MDTVLDILQALGIGAAVGIRPFLPALLVGALAAGDLGVDFEGTDFAFLEEPAFLAAMIVGLVLFDFIRRRGGDERLEAGAGLIVLAAIGGGIAALEGGGSLDDRGGPVAVGMLVAVLGAILAAVALAPLFTRVRARLDKGAAALLPVYREAAALVAAGLSVLFPPLAIVVVGVLLFLLAGGRRREGEKYAGLRILR